jgi:transcriptional regulator with XRE-family HTH domain
MAKSEFGRVLREVRNAVHMTQQQLAAAVSRRSMAVHRWEQLGTVPHLEDRIRIIQALAAAPRADLERLAVASGTTLRAAGIEEPAPPALPSPVVASPSPAPAAPASLSPLAQGLVDDAVREAAEELETTPQQLRPALSRMLDRIARAGVPIEAATRMVLGVPKKPEKSAPTKRA